MNRKLLFSLVGLATSAVALTGCGDNTRRALGMDRNVPDEFSVVTRAPLSLPPDYNLRPPRPGAPRPQEPEPGQVAAQTVFGGPSSNIRSVAASSRSGGSSGEQALLSRAGAGAADPNIRTVVDQEATSLVVADKGWVDSLLFWKKPAPPGTVVNAQLEAQRLKTNAAQGKPVNEGNTPNIERRKKAPLEGLFN